MRLHTNRFPLALLGAVLLAGLPWGLACGDKDGDGDGDGGSADGGSTDGGSGDAGSGDGGSNDAGADGGIEDGGYGDGGPDFEDDCEDGVDNDEDGYTDCEDSDCEGEEACVEQDCTDGEDDDGDELIDCDDPDCLGVPFCPELDCDNGVDDDGDGYADCLDADCLDDPACTVPEDDCGNGVDDDEDGRTDCDDSDCAFAEGCYEHICDDDLDDDGDKLVDCADPDCFGELACIETVCDDGIDDDGDGGIDCRDVDCWYSLPCLQECAEEEVKPLTDGVLAEGDTTDADDTFNDLETCGETHGPDIGHIWLAPRDGCFQVNTDGSDFDTVLRIHESCRTDEIACDEDSGLDNIDSAVYLSAEGGRYYALVVDGQSEYDFGAYSLNIEEYEVPYDEDIGSVTGSPAVTGDIDGLEELVWLPSCAYYTENDDMLLWTAPSAGTWTFDLGESDFDTVLAIIGVNDRCPEELACNDDEDAHAEIYTSIASVELEEGQQVVIWIGNYWAGELGDWEVEITVE